MYLQLENYENAELFLTKRHTITNELFSDFPSNVSFKNNLIVSYAQLGELYLNLNNVEKAYEYFSSNHVLATDLYKNAPENVEYKYDVVSRIYSENQKITLKNLGEKEVKSWNDYQIKEILITREFDEIQEKIRELIVSPLLPKEFKNILTSLYDEAYKCIDSIHQDLEKIKNELPKIYEDSQELNPHDFMDKITVANIDLYSKYNNCIIFLADYLKIEEILKE